MSVPVHAAAGTEPVHVMVRTVQLESEENVQDRSTVTGGMAPARDTGPARTKSPDQRTVVARPLRLRKVRQGGAGEPAHLAASQSFACSSSSNVSTLSLPRLVIVSVIAAR